MGEGVGVAVGPGVGEGVGEGEVVGGGAGATEPPVPEMLAPGLPPPPPQAGSAAAAAVSAKSIDRRRPASCPGALVFGVSVFCTLDSFKAGSS